MLPNPKFELINTPSKSGDEIQYLFQGNLLNEVPKEEFEGKRASTALIRRGKQRVLYTGLGTKEKLNAVIVRDATGLAVRQLLSIGTEEIMLSLLDLTDHLAAAVEGLLLAAYHFDDFKPDERKRKNSLKTVKLLVQNSKSSEVQAALQRGKIMGESINQVRHLGNLPPNEVFPARMAEEAIKLAMKWKLRCRVWDEKQLRKEGFGGILAVGAGSKHPPRFIEIEYQGGKKNQKPLVIIGKAVTFDTGGISIKPAASMEEMKYDKMGGCTVLGIMQAIARLKLPVNVVGLIPSAENMPSSDAYRPSDLVKSYDGKMIEVLNTDAEGRVILADAIAYARMHLKPEWMVDFATLTGAIIVALGVRRAGIFSNQDPLRDLFCIAGHQSGDLVWPMPVGDEYDEQIRSDIACVKNTGGRDAGSCTAASFLKTWAEETPWVHVDIAGTATTSKVLPCLEKGSTGFGVRLTIEAIESWLKK
ncbi:MAG: leucyl aminopeptidase [Verrucomicrobiota bacterium]